MVINNKIEYGVEKTLRTLSYGDYFFYGGHVYLYLGKRTRYDTTFGTAKCIDVADAADDTLNNVSLIPIGNRVIPIEVELTIRDKEGD